MSWVDLVWATVARIPPGELVAREERIRARDQQWAEQLERESESFEAWLEHVKEETVREEQRKTSVTARLQPILALAPVGLTISLGLFVTLAKKDAQADVPQGLLIVVPLAFLYVSLQFLRAFLGALDGLRRRGYESMPLVLPDGTETKKAYKARMARERWAALRKNQDTNNEKISCLEVVHISLRNAFVGVFLLTVLVILFALSRALAPAVTPQSRDAPAAVSSRG